MNGANKKLSAITLLFVILVVAILRVISNFDTDWSLITNFSPLGAMALFGGAYLGKSWKAYAFPLVTILLSDIVLSLTVLSEYSNGILYTGWYWNYAMLAFVVLFGQFLLKHKTIFNIATGVLTTVFIHWIITDFGVWIGGTMYPMTWAGWISCLLAAIPFELNFLVGTTVYSGVMFGVVEWSRRNSFASGFIQSKQ